MNNLWLEWLIEKFVIEDTQIRSCDSCQGGCTNPAICFLCCGYTQKTLDKYIKSKGRDNLLAEFEADLYDDYFGGKD